VDPVATLAQLCEAIGAGHYADAAEHLADLREWDHRGGFAPRVSVSRNGYSIVVNLGGAADSSRGGADWSR
jgi:hypothetical protein